MKVPRKPFVIADEKIAPGETRVFDLPVADLYVHTRLTVPIQVMHGRRSGPVLLICAAMHGDEINGIEIIRRVLTSKRLRSLRGVLIAVPVVNIFGFLNHTRYLPDRRDLNRCFPGLVKGSLASRMAHLFTNEILSRTQFCIDLHTGSNNRENLPQLRAATDDPEVGEMARAFGLPVVVSSPNIAGSLRETAGNLGVKIVVFEGGEALRFDETAIRAGVSGILSVMQHIGMLRSYTRKRQVEPFVAKNTSWVRASQSGIHRSVCSLGSMVNEGDVLAYIASPLGSNEVPVVAHLHGIVIGRMTMPLVTEGEALFHIASFEEPTEHVVEELDRAQDILDGAHDEMLLDEPPIV